MRRLSTVSLASQLQGVCVKVCVYGGREGQGEAAAAIAADKSRKTPFREPRLTRAREEGRERVGGVIKKRGKLQTERERGPGALL